MSNPFFLVRALFYPAFFIVAISLVSCGTKGLPPKASKIKPSAITVSSVEAQDHREFTRVKITADRAFAYNILNHYEPLALVVEIPGANFRGVPEKLSVNKGAVTVVGLRDVLKKKEKQVEIRLSQSVNYQVSKIGASLLVDIENPTVLLSKVQSKAGLLEKITEEGKPQTALIKERQDEYIIGGRDVLEITVYDEPDLDRKVRVSNLGYISFPLIGKVKVAGLTAAEAEKRIESLLKEGYLVNPQVSINIAEYRSNEVYVLGAVNKPGAYPLMGETRLLEALSRAGGVATTEEGSIASKELYLIRGKGGSEQDVEYIKVNLTRLLAQGDLSLNIPIHDKDTIYVPQADSIFVFGEVNSPGPFKLLEKEVTILEAITMAGGLTKYAAPNRARIIRYEGGVGRTIQVDIKEITKSGDRSKDIVLKPGDVVFVPQSYL